MFKIARFFLLSTLPVIPLLVTGCSEGLPGKATPVEGVLTMSGKPLEKVYVQFMPEDSKLPGSTGVTDQSGKFVLKTSDNRIGALVGKHKITVTAERADERSGAKGSPRRVPFAYSQATPNNPLGLVEVTETKKSGYDFDIKPVDPSEGEDN